MRQPPWPLPKSWLGDTDRTSREDWWRYATCRLLGHVIEQDGPYVYWCTRCGDTMPEGKNPWQK